MYQQRLHYFRYDFDDSELIREFETFIQNNLQEFFTYAEQAQFTVTVPWVRVKSVVNSMGSDRRLLQHLSNSIHMTSSNYSNFKNTHQQQAFHVILSESKSFQGLINNIRKYLESIRKEFYQWNVVHYSEYLERVINL